MYLSLMIEFQTQKKYRLQCPYFQAMKGQFEAGVAPSVLHENLDERFGQANKAHLAL